LASLSISLPRVRSVAPPGVQRRAVWSGLDGVRQDVIRVKEGFKDRGAGACIAGVSRGIGRVRRTCALGRYWHEADMPRQVRDRAGRPLAYRPVADDP